MVTQRWYSVLLLYEKAHVCTKYRNAGSSLFNLHHPGISGKQHPEREPCIIMYLTDFFSTSTFFALPPAGLFRCARLRGTQEAQVNTAIQVRALAEVRGTCSEGSKSRNLANNRGIHFRPPGASKVPCKTHRTFFHRHENRLFVLQRRLRRAHSTKQNNKDSTNVTLKRTHQASFSSSSYHAAAFSSALCS